ncbi:MAG: response regulator transcription factor [Cyanobacteria bacterium J06623_7]
MIRLLLVDDQSIIREGLSSLLATQPDLEIIGEAANGEEAIQQSLTLSPDVVLMDIRMPVMDGVAAIRLLKERSPEIKILVLTTFDDDLYVAQAMTYGADGYLLKDTPSQELARAIRAVKQGYTQMGPGLFPKALTNLPNSSSETAVQSDLPQLTELTNREQEVLQLIATGHSNKEIAAQLYITERTVKNHVNSILRTLNLRDRTQAAIFANQHRQ